VGSDSLSCYKADSENFVSWIDTGDVKWIHCFEPNQKDSEWNGIIRLLLGRSLSYPFNMESEDHCFWDAQGVVLVDTMPCGQSINSDLHIQIRKPFQKRFGRVLFHKNVAAVCPEHENARPHTRSALFRNITQRHILFISRLKSESKQNTQEAVTKPS
jgi:hypothetical protein